MFKVLFSGINGIFVVTATVALWYGIFYSILRIVLAFLFHVYAHRPIAAPHGGHGHGHAGGPPAHHHSPVEENVKDLWETIGEWIDDNIRARISAALNFIFRSRVPFTVPCHVLVLALLLILAIFCAWVGHFFAPSDWGILLYFGVPITVIGLVIMPESMWHHRPWNKYQTPSHAAPPTNEQAWYFVLAPMIVAYTIYLPYHYFQLDNFILSLVQQAGWQ